MDRSRQICKLIHYLNRERRELYKGIEETRKRRNENGKEIVPFRIENELSSSTSVLMGRSGCY
jgi:hypothetical protein